MEKQRMAKKKSGANALKFRNQFSSRAGSMDDGSTPPEQRYVTTNTGLGHVLVMIVLGICRRITCSVDIKKRLFVYACLVIFGGIVGDFAPILAHAFMPIKVGKYSILNQWFVKIGWFWILALLTPFIFMTSEVIRASPGDDEDEEECEATESKKLLTKTADQLGGNPNIQLLRCVVNKVLCTKDLLRLVLATAGWYFSIAAFTYYENLTMSCSIVDHKSSDACHRAGGKWTGFDISGHMFLLLYSNLIILEECSAMVGWEPFGNFLYAKQQHQQKMFKEDYEQHVVFRRFIVPIRFFFVSLTILSVMWDFMLLQTALFYHTMIQKLVGFLWAFALWDLLYRVIFKIFNLSVIQISTRNLS